MFATMCLVKHVLIDKFCGYAILNENVQNFPLKSTNVLLYFIHIFSLSIDECRISDWYVIYHIKIHTKCKFYEGI